MIANPFFLAAICFIGGAVFLSWLWFGLFEFGEFWSGEGITKEGKVGLLIGSICGGIFFARAWAYYRWYLRN